jgi:hypothetical protein
VSGPLGGKIGELRSGRGPRPWVEGDPKTATRHVVGAEIRCDFRRCVYEAEQVVRDGALDALQGCILSRAPLDDAGEYHMWWSNRFT